MTTLWPSWTTGNARVLAISFGEQAMDHKSSPELEPLLDEDTGGPAQPRRLNLAVIGIALVLVVVAIVAAIMARSEENPAPVFVVRSGPVADLLGWLPADDEARRAFAVWTADTGLATPIPGTAAIGLQQQLAMEPSPLTLGHSPAWRDTFGWELSQVTGWATAGLNGDLSVLIGNFDRDIITSRLRQAGYDRQTHRGVGFFVQDEVATPTITLNGDSVSAANVVAMIDGKLITSSSRERVTAAIDVAIAGAGSLIDDDTISGMVAIMAPLSALVAVDLADLAAACEQQLPGDSDSDSAKKNYVIVGYGRLGAGGERRTLIAISYPDESTAIDAAPEYERGWVDGFANAGGTGGSIATYGKLTVVSRTSSVLIAELVEGRDDGWVRAGIRYAIPVCEAAMALIARATPIASK